MPAVTGTITSWPIVSDRRCAAALSSPVPLLWRYLSGSQGATVCSSQSRMSFHRSGLVIVHEHRRRDVHRRDEHHAFADAGGGAALLDDVGDVDDLLPLLRLECEIVGVRLHGLSRRVVAAVCTICMFDGETAVTRISYGAPVKRVGFRGRLFLILLAFAVIPSILISLAWSATGSFVLPLAGATAAWDSVAATGERAIGAARRRTADRRAAADAGRPRANVATERRAVAPSRISCFARQRRSCAVASLFAVV